MPPGSAVIRLRATTRTAIATPAGRPAEEGRAKSPTAAGRPPAERPNAAGTSPINVKKGTPSKDVAASEHTTNATKLGVWLAERSPTVTARARPIDSSDVFPSIAMPLLVLHAPCQAGRQMRERLQLGYIALFANLRLISLRVPCRFVDRTAIAIDLHLPATFVQHVGAPAGTFSAGPLFQRTSPASTGCCRQYPMGALKS